MKLLSDIAIAVGLIIFVVSACFIDSPGAVWYYAGAVGIIGALVAGAGYCIKRMTSRHKCDFYYFCQPDKLDGDVEWIEEGGEW